MAVNESAGYSPLISREQAWNKLADAIRLYAGPRRRYSFKQLSNGSGVKPKVIESLLARPDSLEFRPMSLGDILSIAMFLGSDFTNEWLHLAGQGAFDLPEDGDPLPGQFAADVAGDGAEVVRRAADGEFCRDDRAALSVVGQRKIERGMQLVALAKRRVA